MQGRRGVNGRHFGAVSCNIRIPHLYYIAQKKKNQKVKNRNKNIEGKTRPGCENYLDNIFINFLLFI